MSAEGLCALVVDDEAPARQRILDLLRGPDLVFLDVQMPELTGLEAIAQVGAERMPLTDLVTAYDEHAIRAFEANALDYLLKPFSDERFELTMARVGRRTSTGSRRRGITQICTSGGRKCCTGPR